MIELNRNQTRKLESVSISWSPIDAGNIVSVLSGLGLPVYSRTIKDPSGSASRWPYIGLRNEDFCGTSLRGDKTFTIDEFILYLFTEVLV